MAEKTELSTKTRIAIIGCVGVPAKYGGFETLAEYLVEYLAGKTNMTVYCSSRQYTRKIKSYKGAAIEYVNLNANGAQSILYDIISIVRACKANDVLLILGVAGAFILPLVKLFFPVKIIVHIDGMEWKREKWKFYAKKYLQLSESIAIKNADYIIPDNKAILKNINQKYHFKSKMIAYGADHVSDEKLTSKLLSKLEIEGKPYLFSVCRIVPENNIRTIIKACISTQQYLVIIGNWYDSQYGLATWQDYVDNPYVKLVNPIYNQSELDALRSNCTVYIHGHSAGGTNPSLVEAMFLGLNIVAFDVSFNKNTLGGKGLFFKNQKELEQILTAYDGYENFKEYHKTFAMENYKWEKIAEEYFELFNSL